MKNLKNCLAMLMVFILLSICRVGTAISPIYKEEVEIYYLLAGNSLTQRQVVYHNGFQDISIIYNNVYILKLTKKGSTTVEIFEEGVVVEWRGKIGAWSFLVKSPKGYNYTLGGFYQVSRDLLSKFNYKGEDLVPIMMIGVFPDLYRYLVAKEGPYFTHVYFYTLELSGG